MGGLNHDFFIRYSGPYDENFKNKLKSVSSVTIHDDLIGYLWDFLRWIPSYNPNKNEKMHGLCRWGQTEIDYKGAKKLKEILVSVINLISVGPSILKLHGNYWELGSEPVLRQNPKKDGFQILKANGIQVFIKIPDFDEETKKKVKRRGYTILKVKKTIFIEKLQGLLQLANFVIKIKKGIKIGHGGI